MFLLTCSRPSATPTWFRLHDHALTWPHPLGHVHHTRYGLMGSIAGLYMMGVGGALRWQPDNAMLRANLDAVVDGIAACAEEDGFIMAYEKNTTGRTEHPDYVLSWVSLRVELIDLPRSTFCFDRPTTRSSLP
jgi:hypothetical protein